jgi:hypothetical protein
VSENRLMRIGGRPAAGRGGAWTIGQSLCGTTTPQQSSPWPRAPVWAVALDNTLHQRIGLPNDG